MNFIDLGTNVTNGTKLAIALLRQRIDNSLGYPKRPTKLDGTPFYDPSNDSFGVTTTATDLIQHPTDATRFALPIRADHAAAFAAVKAACVAKVQAGTATAVETAIASLPAAGALDPSWT